MTRRSALLAGPGALLAAASRSSTFGGVPLGIQSRSFLDRPLEEAAVAMAQIGASACELSGVHLEPKKLPPGGRREWRMGVPLDLFSKAGDTLRKAGVEPHTLTYVLFQTPGSEAEIARGFEMAKALGATDISSSTKLSIVPLIDAAAKRYKMRVGLHNHSLIRPDEVTTPDDFKAALRGRSEYLAITLDIGHFTAAGFDAAQWLKENHQRVMSLHIKDRKKNEGPNVPFGQGDTPIGPVLRYTREKMSGVPALIEYEYVVPDTVAEVRKCFEYCKNILLS